MDPDPVRWMRDVEVLLWTTSSGKKLRLGGGRSRVWGFVAGFRGLGVRMGGRMGWQWGTMALRRACPKCGVSYESTPTDFRQFFRFRGITGISHVGVTQEVGVFARVVILE